MTNFVKANIHLNLLQKICMLPSPELHYWDNLYLTKPLTDKDWEYFQTLTVVVERISST